MCSTTTNSTTSTTRAIVTDYFHWRLINQSLTNNRLFAGIRQIAYDCERAYYLQQPTFRFHFSSSPLIQLQTIHHEIAKELFKDGNITWTRIVTLISFSALLAERVVEEQPLDRDLILASFIDWTTDFIDTDLRLWLENQNYWAGYLKMYDKTPERRNSIGRYASILGTIGMLTLGALYLNRI